MGYLLRPPDESDDRNPVLSHCLNDRYQSVASLRSQRQAGADPHPERRACCTPVCGIGDLSIHASLTQTFVSGRKVSGCVTRLMPASAAVSITILCSCWTLTPNWSYFRYHVFMDQLILLLGNRHSPDERRGRLGLPSVMAIRHRLPQVSYRIGSPVTNSLKHAIMETRFACPKSRVAEFQRPCGLSRMKANCEPTDVAKLRREATSYRCNPIGSLVQDIEVISSSPRAFRWLVTVGIGGQTARDRTRLTFQHRLRRSVSLRLVGIRIQPPPVISLPQKTSSMYSSVCLLFIVFLIVPVATDNVKLHR